MDTEMLDTILELKGNYIRCMSGVGDKRFCRRMQQPMIANAKKHYTQKLTNACDEQKLSATICNDIPGYITTEFANIYE